MWDELKKLLKHTTIYGVGGLLGKLAGFLLIPFYTHYLSPAQYGTLELLDLSLSLTAIILNVVVAAPLVRFFYDYEDDTERRRVVSTALLASAFGALLISAGGVIFANQLSVLILKAPGLGLYFRVISASFFLMCVNAVAWNYLRARERSTLIVSVNLASLVVTLSLNIFFIAGLHMGVLGVLCSGLIGHLLNTSIIGTCTLRFSGIHFDAAKMAAMAKFGAPMIISSLGAFVLNFSDRFFLQHYRTLADVGVYALGYKFGFILNFLLIQPFFMIWPPRLYALAKQDDARETVSRVGTYFSLILTVGVLAISATIRDVIKVIASPDYQAAYRVVPLIALAYLCQGMTSFFQVPLFLEKRTSYIALTGCACGVLNIVFNWSLIPRFGAMGAAWATLLSFAASAAMAYIISQQIYRVPYRLARLCMPVAAAAALYFASDIVDISSPYLSAAVKVMFVPAFLLAIYVIGFFDEKEVNKLRSLGRSLLRYRLSAVVPSERA
jgi:O-antigen/teichoic acid export membrane protein